MMNNRAVKIKMTMKSLDVDLPSHILILWNTQFDFSYLGSTVVKLQHISPKAQMNWTTNM